MPDTTYDVAVTPEGYPLVDVAYGGSTRGNHRLRLWFTALPVGAESLLDSNGMAPYLRITCKTGLSIEGGLRDGDECAGNGPYGGPGDDPRVATPNPQPMVLWMSGGSFPLRFAADLSIQGGAGKWMIRLWATLDPVHEKAPDPQWCVFTARYDIAAGPSPAQIPVFPTFAAVATFTS